MSFTEIVMLILGAGGGGAVIYIIMKLKAKADSALMQKDLLVAQGRVVELVKQNADLLQKYTDSQTVLANTLSALELLKAYQMIDAETKRKVDEIKETFVDGKATDDTMAKYKEMLKAMNDQFSGYNKGQKSTTPTPPAPATTPATKTTAKKRQK